MYAYVRFCCLEFLWFLEDFYTFGFACRTCQQVCITPFFTFIMDAHHRHMIFLAFRLCVMNMTLAVMKQNVLQYFINLENSHVNWRCYQSYRVIIFRVRLGYNLDKSNDLSKKWVIMAVLNTWNLRDYCNFFIIWPRTCAMRVEEVSRGWCTHTHNHFTALLGFVQDHPGEQLPER